MTRFATLFLVMSFVGLAIAGPNEHAPPPGTCWECVVVPGPADAPCISVCKETACTQCVPSSPPVNPREPNTICVKAGGPLPWPECGGLPRPR